MKVLHVLNPKIPYSQWHRLGDTNLALRLVKALKGLTENHVIADLTEVYARGLIHQITTEYDATFIDSYPVIQDRRQYQAPMFQYIRSIAHEYDVIHFQQAQSTIPALINKYLGDLDMPIVYTVHTPPEMRSTAFYYKQDFVDFAMSTKRALVSVSNSLESRLSNVLELDTKYIYTICNGIDMRIAQDTKPLSERTYDFIIVGRLDSVKNIDKALEFCSQYGDGQSKILYIGDTFKASYKNKGDDAYVDYVYDFIESNPNIFHISSATQSEVYDYFADSKININLSTVETFSLTSVESMMCGTPVIGFNKNGIGELVENGVSGYLAPLEPRMSWKSKFKSLGELVPKALELDLDSLRTYAYQFDISNTADSYVDLYHDLIGGKSNV